MPIGDKHSSSRRILLVAAAALTDSQGRVLITQRPQHKAFGGFWEFPGGKLEQGEGPEQALVRELREELSLTVNASALAPFAFASHAYEDFHLLMPLFVVTSWQGQPIANPDAVADIKWVRASEMRALPMPPADLVLVERLIEREAMPC